MSSPSSRLAGLLTLCVVFAPGCATHLYQPSSPHPQPARVTASFTVTRDVIYTPPGWPAALPADLYVPTLAANTPRPAVLLLHGGGWTDG
ncbi:MAG: hypothetical protein H7Y06_08405, partial [Opitutaceae bacterium]|nr:hypothetical protein [Opitutaceae bacterium]